MKVRELFEKADKQRVIDTLIEIYKGRAIEGNDLRRQKLYDAYDKLWDTLKAKPDKEHIPVTLLLGKTIKTDEDEEFVDICCYDGKQEYAIDFVAWEEVCNYYVADEAFSYFDITELTAHLLWEISFHGMTEETMLKRKQELDEAIAELENDMASARGKAKDEEAKPSDKPENYMVYDAQIAKIKTEKGLD